MSWTKFWHALQLIKGGPRLVLQAKQCWVVFLKENLQVFLVSLELQFWFIVKYKYQYINWYKICMVW